MPSEVVMMIRNKRVETPRGEELHEQLRDLLERVEQTIARSRELREQHSQLGIPATVGAPRTIGKNDPFGGHPRP